MPGSNTTPDGSSLRKQRQVRWLVWIIGFSLSAALFAYTQSRETQRIRFAFQQRASAQESILRERLTRYEEMLYALRSFFAYSEEVTPEEFAGATQEISRRTSGIQALEWAPVVEGAERAAFEAAQRARSFRGYEIKDRSAGGELRRAPDRPRYTPLQYVEPVSANEVVAGLDISAPGFNEAVTNAERTGQPIGSAPRLLVQEKEGQKGWIIVCPVFYPDTPANGSPRLRGFVQGVFRLPDMLRSAWAGQTDGGVDILVVDVPRAGPREPIYFRQAGQNQPGRLVTEAEVTRGLHLITDIFPAGRHWQLSCPALRCLAGQCPHRFARDARRRRRAADFAHRQLPGPPHRSVRRHPPPGQGAHRRARAKPALAHYGFGSGPHGCLGA